MRGQTVIFTALYRCDVLSFHKMVILTDVAKRRVDNANKSVCTS